MTPIYRKSYNGETVREASTRLGFRKNGVLTRLRHGWDVHDAFTIPIQKRNKLPIIQLDEKEIIIFSMRLNGLTLEQVAKSFSVTRERVRQIEQKIIEKVRQSAAKRKIFSTATYNEGMEENYKAYFDRRNKENVYPIHKETDLSWRTQSYLEKAGFWSINDLAEKTEYELLLIDGMGPQGIEEIKQSMSKYKLALKS